jgi:hypothetical protein
MENKQAMLARLHAESTDVREAIAFYVGFCSHSSLMFNGG